MHVSFGFTAAIAAVLSATTTVAEPISTCASGADNVCYAVGVPSTSASSTTGNLYIQISAPTTYSWVGLGVGGSEMAGANMFIMYADGAGNVTVSSRQGKGNVQPQYSASTASDLHLLSGSGVSNGMMVANIMCTDCKTWSGGSLSTASTSSPWIGAWKAGSALDSASPSQSITYHDAHTSFNLDLTQATLTTDSNPFTSSAATGSGSSTGVTQGEQKNTMVIVVHGVGMALVFVVFYPLGAAVMPLLGKWWFHAAWQMITWLGMWAFFGLGVFGAQERSLLFNNAHTSFGTAIVCLLAIQPALGQLHHQYFVKHGRRNIISYAHLWWGRILMPLGVINGGLGLQLGHKTGGLAVAYSIIAVVIYLAYLAIKLLTLSRRRKQTQKNNRKHSTEHGDEVPMTAYGDPNRHYIQHGR